MPTTREMKPTREMKRSSRWKALGWCIPFIQWITVVALMFTGACGQPAGLDAEGVGQAREAVTTSTATTLTSANQFSLSNGALGTCFVDPGAHYYAARSIVPSSSGSYSMSTVASNSFGSTNLSPSDFGQYDTVLFLVSGAFNPSSPTSNIIACNDDNGLCPDVPTGCLSTVASTLTSGQQYTLVITTFTRGATGPVALNVNGPSSVAVISSMTASGGTPQSTAINTAFSTPLSVTVRDDSNNPVQGVTVNFSAPGSGASATLSASTATTDASGVASVNATANGTSGSYSVAATISGTPGVSASFSLTNTTVVVTPSSVAATGGTPQSATVNTAFSTPLSVTVRDAGNNPVSGVMVTFAAPGSGATAALGSTTATTDASGVASVNATAGTVAGNYSVTASVSGVGSPATFSLTNLAGAPATVVVSSGSNQSTTVGTSFAAPLVALVSDTFGNVVSGATVSFAAPGSGASASLGAPSGTTNAQGLASVTASANSTSGSYTVTASAAGASTSASFQLTNASCSFTLSSTSGSFGAGAASSSVDVTASDPACAWSASSNDGWLTGVTAGGTGSGTVSYSVGVNAGPARTGTLTLAGQTFTVTQAAGCTYVVAPTSASATAAGGSGSVTVTASDPACAWSASSNASWLTGVTGAGTGSGTVSYTAAANTGVGRSGTITVAGQIVTVDQQDGCTFALDATSANVAPAGGSGSIGVTASDPACAWTASSSDSWITGVTSGGTGSGSVSFQFSANAGLARTGTITVAGQTFTVDQGDGCVASLSSTTSAAPAAGGPASFTVTMSGPSCPWTASSSDAFITDLTTGGMGTGTVSFTVTASSGPSRTGTITVAGQTFTVTQADGCSYLLAPTGATSPAGGGDGSFGISASDPACAWTASANDSWISNVSAGGFGDGTVAYHVEANAGPGRVGSITVGGRTFTITQANGCVATLDPPSIAAPAAAGDTSLSITMSDPACMWTAGSNTSWAVVDTGDGTGSGTVQLTLAANAGPARSTTIEVAGHTVNVDQASGCAVSLPVQSGTFTSDAGSSTFNVTTPAGCAYTAASNDSWITDVAVTATGVSFTVGASEFPLRTGTITVTSTTTSSTATFTISQAAGCVMTLPSGGASPSADGGSAFITVTRGPGCQYTASTMTPWIRDLRTDPTGISYTVDPNDGPARAGTIDVINTDTHEVTSFAVNQKSGCVVTLPSSQTSVSKDGGDGSFTVTSGPACTWLASSTDKWISGVVVTAEGVKFTVAASSDAARTATITVQSEQSDSQASFTIGQASGCSVNLPVASAELGVLGGSGSFDVVTGAGCTFTAASDSGWANGVTVSGGGVRFSVDRNDGVARTATLTITTQDTGADASFSVHQSGPITSPQIMTQPVGAHLFVGDPFVLTVVASGGDLHYQWRKDGADIPGATAADYRVMQSRLEDAGSYTVLVSNGAGSVTTTAAIVTITTRGGDGDGGVAPPDGGIAIDAPVGTADAGTSIDGSSTQADTGVVRADGGSASDAGTGSMPDAKPRFEAGLGDGSAPIPDAGLSSADAGSVGPPADSSDGGGCSCRMGAQAPDRRFALALVALGVALGVRRRRRAGR